MNNINFAFILVLKIVHYQMISTSRTNFQIKSFRLCNDTQGLFKFKGNITKENNYYLVDGYVVITRPLDEHIGATCLIESKISKIKYMELFTIRESNFCKACNVYLGEFWYDIQRGAQVIPGTCPLPPKKYETHHLRVDFNRISLQTFPFGTLRITARLVDNKHPSMNLFCVQTMLENIPNE